MQPATPQACATPSGPTSRSHPCSDSSTPPAQPEYPGLGPFADLPDIHFTEEEKREKKKRREKKKKKRDRKKTVGELKG